MREKTRNERYSEKKKNAISIPLSLASVNFHCDDNLAFLIRTAACFGINTIHVIGHIPPRKVLFNASGSLIDYIELKQYSKPSHFLDWVRKSDVTLVSAELDDEAEPLYNHSFSFEKETLIVLGNERIGVPSEILFNSKKLFIPMLGTGFCLNTSQTGTAFVSEYMRQYLSGKQ